MTAALALPLPARHHSLELRRARWIRAQRLSPSEAADLPADFDPGPEFDGLEAANAPEGPSHG